MMSGRKSSHVWLLFSYAALIPESLVISKAFIHGRHRSRAHQPPPTKLLCKGIGFGIPHVASSAPPGGDTIEASRKSVLTKLYVLSQRIVDLAPICPESGKAVVVLKNSSTPCVEREARNTRTVTPVLETSERWEVGFDHPRGGRWPEDLGYAAKDPGSSVGKTRRLIVKIDQCQATAGPQHIDLSCCAYALTSIVCHKYRYVLLNSSYGRPCRIYSCHHEVQCPRRRVQGEATRQPPSGLVCMSRRWLHRFFLQ